MPKVAPASVLMSRRPGLIEHLELEAAERARPWIDGGGNAATIAPGIMNSGPLKRCSTALSD